MLNQLELEEKSAEQRLVLHTCLGKAVNIGCMDVNDGYELVKIRIQATGDYNNPDKGFNIWMEVEANRVPKKGEGKIVRIGGICIKGGVSRDGVDKCLQEEYGQSFLESQEALKLLQSIDNIPENIVEKFKKMTTKVSHRVALVFHYREKAMLVKKNDSLRLPMGEKMRGEGDDTAFIRAARKVGPELVYAVKWTPQECISICDRPFEHDGVSYTIARIGLTYDFIQNAQKNPENCAFRVVSPNQTNVLQSLDPVCLQILRAVIPEFGNK